MSCDEIKELLAAYAIGALGEDERREVDEHLSECRRHDEALAGLSSVVNALPLTVEERDPPPELRARLLERMQAESSSAPVSLEAERERRRPAFRLSWALGVAAAAAIAGLLIWNVALLTSDDGGGEQLVRTQTVEHGDARLVYLPDEDVAVLDLDFVELLPGQVYQAWEMHGDTPESLGVMPESGSAAFPGISDADAIAVSIEPAPGSDQPTAEPILVMALD